MKQFLILIGLSGAAVCNVPGASPSVQHSSPEPPAVQTEAASPKPTGLKQLSDQERAVLRRQLYQYSRIASKG
ncbi:MAG: hypothetical protein H0X13_14745 [Ramlibacter sp.]|nr:hypothetical protein [Ramlibacter sp.]